MSDSKQRMLAKAAELFQKQGYSGTGLKQIIEESGTPRGSLYFHFPGGKEELAVEALQYACEARLETMHAIFDETSSTLDAVGMLVDHARLIAASRLRLSVWPDGPRLSICVT